MKQKRNRQKEQKVHSVGLLEVLTKIIAQHEWDRERSIMEGNFTGASIFAIKREAVEHVRRALSIML